MAPAWCTGLNPGTRSQNLTSIPAEEAIERILELSADARIERPEVAEDPFAFNARTETIVHTTPWREKFASFLEHLSAVARPKTY